MNTSKKLIFVLSLALLPSLSFARGDRGDRGDRGPNPKRVEKILKQLDLTAEQSAKIEAIHEGDKEARKAKKQEAKAARKAFQEALGNASTTDDQLKAMNEEMIASKSDEMRSRFSKMLEVRSVLTVEQRAEFQKLMKENKGKRGREGKMRKNKKGSQ